MRRRRGCPRPLSNTNQPPVHATDFPPPRSPGPAPARAYRAMPTPASLHTHQDRQHQRLTEATARVWHRHDGHYQHEIQALLALVDTGQMKVRDAHERLVDLEQRTRRQAA